MSARPSGWAKRIPALRAPPGALDTAVFVFPLLLVYQVGIALGVRNGADLLTALLMRLVDRSLGRYLLLLAGLLLAYAGLLAVLRRSGRFHPRRFLPLLAESGIYALAMGSLILLVMRLFLGLVPGPVATNAVTRGPLEILVISAGAGLHEELVFRFGLLGGLALLLQPRFGRRPAWIAALVLSSLAFAAVHHLGPLGEAFTPAAFAYRCLAGVCFGAIYQARGFAVAAWTHCLYDLYVLSSS